MYPFPAIAGERMTLRCLVWGTDEVKRSVFYKENTVIKTINGESFQLDSVNESNVGKYKCVATYRHKGQTISTPHQYGSDAQEVLVHGMHSRYLYLWLLLTIHCLPKWPFTLTDSKRYSLPALCKTHIKAKQEQYCLGFSKLNTKTIVSTVSKLYSFYMKSICSISWYGWMCFHSQTAASVSITKES